MPTFSKPKVLDRGNRLTPKRSDRIDSSLVKLLDRLEFLLESDLLPAGDRLLDYGCGNRPYEPIFLKKFAKYVGGKLDRLYGDKLFRFRRLSLVRLLSRGLCSLLSASLQSIRRKLAGFLIGIIRLPTIKAESPAAIKQTSATE